MVVDEIIDAIEKIRSSRLSSSSLIFARFFAGKYLAIALAKHLNPYGRSFGDSNLSGTLPMLSLFILVLLIAAIVQF